MELRTSALRALDGVLGYDTDGAWVQHLTQRGFVQSFVNAFHVLDGAASSSSSSSSTNNKDDASLASAISYFEASMTLLIRIALTKVGASLLIDVGVIDVMSLCPSVYSPEPLDPSKSFTAGASTTWHRIIMPCLTLVATMGSTLGTPHRRYVEQSCNFLSENVMRRSGRTGAVQFSPHETMVECLLHMTATSTSNQQTSSSSSSSSSRGLRAGGGGGGGGTGGGRMRVRRGGGGGETMPAGRANRCAALRSGHQETCSGLPGRLSTGRGRWKTPWDPRRSRNLQAPPQTPCRRKTNASTVSASGGRLPAPGPSKKRLRMKSLP